MLSISDLRATLLGIRVFLGASFEYQNMNCISGRGWAHLECRRMQCILFVLSLGDYDGRSHRNIEQRRQSIVSALGDVNKARRRWGGRHGSVTVRDLVSLEELRSKAGVL